MDLHDALYRRIDPVPQKALHGDWFKGPCKGEGFGSTFPFWAPGKNRTYRTAMLEIIVLNQHFDQLKSKTGRLVDLP